MKIKLQLHLLIYIACYSFAVSQDFFVLPLDTGVVGNGARTFNLQLQNGTTSFFPGIETETSGYNGNFLGPTLLMQKGDSVVMNVTNTMPFATTTHWHGMHLPAVMDGGPHQLIEQNETWVATWGIKNRASTYWYHPHPHPDGFPIDTLKATGWQVYQGMAGLLIVKDTETDTLGLPAEYGVDDIPIILQDRSFTADSSHFAPIPPQGSGLANIRRGYTIMVNGVVTPTLNSYAQMIRLRILNASNARTYRLGFSDNRPFFVIGSDGGILDTISTVTRLDMSPAERYEIVVDFSNANGSTIKLMAYNSEIESNIYPNGLPGNIYWISPLLDDYDTSDFDIMTFDIGNPTANAVTSFNQGLTDIVRIDPETADNVNNPRTFVLAAPVGNGNGFTINGSLFDASIIDDVISLGAMEVWDVENTANMAHPFHIHGNSFQVVSRTNSVRPMHDYELGWKDVVVVYSQETVRVIKSFEDYADPDGPYMSHCHILEHEDAGMMTHWVVVDQYQPTMSLQFDGIDDRVTVPYNSSFPTEVFTISAWVKLNQPNGKSAIIARGEDDNSYNLSWQLFVSSLGELEIMLEDEDEQNFCYPYNNCVSMGACTIIGDLFISDNTWHHVAAARDGSGTLSMYIDGELRASCDGTGIPSSDNYQNLSIGCTFGFIGPPPDGIEPPIWFFTGQIDEPTMWNESLSHEEIVDLFISNIDINSPALIGYWTFNEGDGQIVSDLSLAENNGYLGDSPEIDSSDPFWDFPGQGELIVDHLASWNLIGLPFESTSFPCSEYVEESLYSFENGNYVNGSVDNMSTGPGYWLRFDEAGTCTFSGEPVNELSITLSENWNLISGVSFSVPLNSIIDPDNLIVHGTVYGFDGTYVEAETIDPGYGYWLRSTGEGEITISSSAIASKTKSFQRHKHINTLTLNNFSLYFGGEVPEENILSYSLPPKPPAPSTDIRFSGNTKLCSTDDCVIEIMNNGSPLTFECNIKDGESWVLVPVIACPTGRRASEMKWSEAISLDKQGQLTLDSGVEQWLLRKSTTDVPTTFALHPAYPNPFNPITTIRFSVGVMHALSIKVYDITGRLIETLIDKELNRGHHTIQWNANTFSSGVYIVRLEAGTFSQSQKLILLK